MNGRLKKSIRTYGQLVEAVPMVPNMQRTPEFREAHKYLTDLFTEFGPDQVRAAVKQLLGWSGMERIQ